MTEPEKLYKVVEAAAYLGTSRYFVWDHVRDGSLAAVQLGGNRLVRIRQSDLDRFVSSRLRPLKNAKK
jgi:excisionase family DNA binding protein